MWVKPKCHIESPWGGDCMNRLISGVAALEYERRLAKIEENRRSASWLRHVEIPADSNEYECRLAGLVAEGAHLESGLASDSENSNKFRRKQETRKARP